MCIHVMYFCQVHVSGKYICQVTEQHTLQLLLIARTKFSVDLHYRYNKYKQLFNIIS